jgi:hypothetical protein
MIVSVKKPLTREPLGLAIGFRRRQQSLSLLLNRRINPASGRRLSRRIDVVELFTREAVVPAEKPRSYAVHRVGLDAAAPHGAHTSFSP